MIMDAPERAALKTVWCIAAALVIISLVNIGLYLTQCLVPKPQMPVKIFSCIVKSIPALLGIAALIKSKALAQWISDKLD
jgi:hypothetical protein